MQLSIADRNYLRSILVNHQCDGMTAYYLRPFVEALEINDDEDKAFAQQPCTKSALCRVQPGQCSHRTKEIDVSKRCKEIVQKVLTTMSKQDKLSVQLVPLVILFAPELLPAEEVPEQSKGAGTMLDCRDGKQYQVT